MAGISWNLDYFHKAKLSKAAFIKKFKKVYPEADLNVEYYKIYPRKK